MGIGRFVFGVIIIAVLIRTGILSDSTGPTFALASIAFIFILALYAWIVSG